MREKLICYEIPSNHDVMIAYCASSIHKEWKAFHRKGADEAYHKEEIRNAIARGSLFFILLLPLFTEKGKIQNDKNINPKDIKDTRRFVGMFQLEPLTAKKKPIPKKRQIFPGEKEKTVYLKNVRVEEALRRYGIGTEIKRAVFKEASQRKFQQLTGDVVNIRLLSFYGGHHIKGLIADAHHAGETGHPIERFTWDLPLRAKL